MDLDFLHKSSLKWLPNSVIFLARHGSHAYGTSTPESDLDLRGIAIPPKEYYLGILNKFDQAEFKDPYDAVIFDLKKFVKLSLDNNPNALEIIFTEPEDHLLITPIGQSLLEIKDSFLSKKAKFTLSGYAHQQLRRMNVHHKWLRYGKEFKKPEREHYGLSDSHRLIPASQLSEIEAAINKRLSQWVIDTTGMENDAAIDFKNNLYDVLLDLKVNHDDMDVYAARSLGLNDNLMEAFKKERQYKAALREWNQYETWQKERNPKRHEIEYKFGYDLKHGMHLCRLHRMCRELLETHQLKVRRPDAEELLAIRNGAWTYEYLIEWADKEAKALDELYKTSSLRREPDRNKINQWLVSTIQNYYA